MNTCIVKVEGGVCGQPGRHPVKVQLPVHDYLMYVEEVKLKPILICDDHFKPIMAGWRLSPQVIFRWVPPK